MWTGGGCVGFIHGRTDIASAAPAAASTVYAFSGNKDIATSLQGANAALAPIVDRRLSVNVIRLDDYTLANNGVCMLNADIGTPGNVSLRMVDGVAPAGSLTLSTITGEFASMIQVLSAGIQTAPAGVITYTADALKVAENSIDAETIGVYANLGLKDHFLVDRSVAANAPLRSTIQAINAKPGATNDALDFGRMQGMLDEILILGGEDPDCLYVHPIFRQEYSSLLSFTSATNTTLVKDVQAGAGKADAGYSAYSFNNIPVKMSRHCGKGLVVFLRTKTWCITELQSFGMADLDGNVLSRLPNRDEWEGFVRWYYNLVCKEPNRNAILCGIKFSGM